MVLADCLAARQPDWWQRIVTASLDRSLPCGYATALAAQLLHAIRCSAPSTSSTWV